MSRSRRKTPICPVTTCNSEKKEKTQINRRLRRINKRELSEGKEVFKTKREISNVWWMQKDGRRGIDLDDPDDEKLMRK